MHEGSTAEKVRLVISTHNDLTKAKELARRLVEARYAACVNIIPKIVSIYHWEGKIEEAEELLLIVKTTTTKLAALQSFIESNHPYDTPEILALPLAGGADRYLGWVLESTT